MNMPEFNAELSLYKTAGRYALQSVWIERSSNSVSLQQKGCRPAFSGSVVLVPPIEMFPACCEHCSDTSCSGCSENPGGVLLCIGMKKANCEIVHDVLTCKPTTQAVFRLTAAPQPPISHVAACCTTCSMGTCQDCTTVGADLGCMSNEYAANCTVHEDKVSCKPAAPRPASFVKVTA